jgi:aspartate ammonia-lyase
MTNNKIYYGEETRKALGNFGASIEENHRREWIQAYAEVKLAALSAIQETEKHFEEAVFDAIIEAIEDIMAGKLDGQFQLPLRQGGAGTSIHMNMNEVIASYSEEIVFQKNKKRKVIDPLENINRYQSTNDTFPTVVTIVAYRRLLEIEEKVIQLQEVLVKKENEYNSVLITGRTEMRDALPIGLGQVFAGWAGAVERDRWRLHKLKERIRTVALGGTAIGTCFSAPQDYIFSAEKQLRKITGLPLSRSQNFVDEISNQDKFAELANGFSLCAQNLFKISGDLLLYTSSMLGEIKHPDLQYGSTIMPAKTNPVILEWVRGLSIDTKLECTKINEYSQQGQLQLNVCLPFILDSLLKASDSLGKALEGLVEKFFNKMEINEDRIQENLLHSNVLLNSLLPILGYHKIKKIYALLEEKKPSSMEEWKEIIIKNTDLNKNDLDLYLEPARLTGMSNNPLTPFERGKK